MGPKKPSSSKLKKKKPIPLVIKMEIIEKHTNGAQVKDLCKEYGRGTSTICTILKQKDALIGRTPAKGLTILSKRRTPAIDEMEGLLHSWIREQQLSGDSISKADICEKARAIYSDLTQDAPSTSSHTQAVEPFKASHGWFARFWKRQWEAVSYDAKVSNVENNEQSWTPSQESAPLQWKELKTVRRGRKGKTGVKKTPISLEIKMEIIKKHNNGARVKDLCKEYGRGASTICTILKQKDALKGRTPAKGLTILSKRRTPAIDEMERLLLIWIREQQLPGDPITRAVICEKARSIYSDLARGDPSAEPFKASHGWFDKFKKRQWETTSSDAKAAAELVTAFTELVKSEGSSPQQVFNCDETELFWKEMPTPSIKEQSLEEEQEEKEQVLLEEEEDEEEMTITTKALKEFLEHWQHVAHFVQTKHPQTDCVLHAISLFNNTCVSYFRRILQSRKIPQSLDAFFTDGPSPQEEEEECKVEEEIKDRGEEEEEDTKKKIRDDNGSNEDVALRIMNF